MDSGKRLSLNRTLQIQSEIINKEIDNSIPEAFGIQFGWEGRVSPLDGTGHQALGTGPPGRADAAELLCRRCLYIFYYYFFKSMAILLLCSGFVKYKGTLLVGIEPVYCLAVHCMPELLWECMEPRV